MKAQNILLSNENKYDVLPSISLQLFDSFVASTLNYSCAVWGFTKTKSIERVHLKFCKSILSVKQSTSTASVYYELGRYPLYIQRYVQIIKFWLHIINSENNVVKVALYSSIELHENGYISWAGKVHSILNEYGFSDVWLNPFKYGSREFIQIFRRRLVDCFIQKVNSDIQSSSLLTNLYLHLTDSFAHAFYLNNMLNKTYRRCLSRIRLSSHNLMIESKRYGPNRLPREERKCMLCSCQDIEDEFHFILACNCYKELRKRFIKPYYYRRPSMFKFIQLLNSRNKSEIINLSKYIHFANKRRYELINVTL